MSERCPLCGTSGKLWNKNPEVFLCPNCATLFSQFGIVLESQKELPDIWH